jgi:hypothetical protein
MGMVFWTEVFRERRLDFWAWTEIQKDPMHNVCQEVEI